jgi:hypothetical protein
MTYPSFSAGEVLRAADMNAVGLWKVASATATSGTTLDISNCFSSDYDAYKLVITDLRTTNDASFSLQLLNGSTPATTNYAWAFARVAYDATTPPAASGYPSYVSSWASQVSAGTVSSAFTMEIFDPYLAQFSYFTCNSTDKRGVNGYGVINGAGVHATASSYTGIRVTLSANAFTNATATVYGYRK